MKIEIYTDGACSGNPGKGGYGIVMKIREKKHEKRFSKGFRHTTNNRMELLAVLTALEKLATPQQDVHVYTDSKYVADAINKKWLYGWVKKQFKNVKNSDLWKKMPALLQKHHVEFHWVKGHAGHLENEICDELAVEASKSSVLAVDTEFEKSTQKTSLF